jgi:hypothetical protein
MYVIYEIKENTHWAILLKGTTFNTRNKRKWRYIVGARGT